MILSVISDGSELSNYAVMKMLNSASKTWDAKIIVFLTGGSEKHLSEYKKRVMEKAKGLSVNVEFSTIERGGASEVVKGICEIAVSKKVTGIFIPENMSELSEGLKNHCSDIPVEDVSTDLFPSIWDLMTKRVTTVNVNDTLNYAATQMAENKIGSLIVMDRGRVSGILTEHDFVLAYSKNQMADKKVKDAMSHPVITLDRTGTIFEACELMKKHQIKKLVIMDGQTLQGIITTTDIAKLPLSISESLNFLVTKIKELSI